MPMTHQERRGKRLFLVLATTIILHKLLDVGFAFTGGLATVNWMRGVLQPAVIAISVAYIWEGENWLRCLLGAAFVLHGAVQLWLGGRVLIAFAEKTPPKAAGYFWQVIGIPFGIIALIGLFYVMAGLLFLFSPSMRAFFKYQRERPLVRFEIE